MESDDESLKARILEQDSKSNLKPPKRQMTEKQLLQFERCKAAKKIADEKRAEEKRLKVLSNSNTSSSSVKPTTMDSTLEVTNPFNSSSSEPVTLQPSSDSKKVSEVKSDSDVEIVRSSTSKNTKKKRKVILLSESESEPEEYVRRRRSVSRSRRRRPSVYYSSDEYDDGYDTYLPPPPREAYIQPPQYAPSPEPPREAPRSILKFL